MKHFLRSLTKKAFGVAVIATAVKYSADLGVWTTSTEEGALLFSRLKSRVLPGTIVYPEELPSTAEVKQKVVYDWNNAINYTFGCVKTGIERSSQVEANTSK